MSIRNRLEDAQYMWEAGRLEGAFVSVLIAVAATSKLVFPKRGDKEAFEGFLSQGWFQRISVEYRGEVHPVYHIFYKWIRCELIHEGTIPVDVRFVEDPEQGVLGIRAGGAPEYVLEVSKGWYFELMATVLEADVNRNLLSELTKSGFLPIRRLS
jgi:hypothetical protein